MITKAIVKLVERKAFSESINFLNLDIYFTNINLINFIDYSHADLCYDNFA